MPPVGLNLTRAAEAEMEEQPEARHRFLLPLAIHHAAWILSEISLSWHESSMRSSEIRKVDAGGGRRGGMDGKRIEMDEDAEERERKPPEYARRRHIWGQIHGPRDADVDIKGRHEETQMPLTCRAGDSWNRPVS